MYLAAINIGNVYMTSMFKSDVKPPNKQGTPPSIVVSGSQLLRTDGVYQAIQALERGEQQTPLVASLIVSLNERNTQLSFEHMKQIQFH